MNMVIFSLVCIFSQILYFRDMKVYRIRVKTNDNKDRVHFYGYSEGEQFIVPFNFSMTTS